MSPVAPSSGHASRALVLSLVAVVVGMGAVWGASMLITSRHNQRAAQTSVGGVVDLGRATKLAGQISRDGGVPVYYPDVSGNNARSVYVTHRGTDPDHGLVGVPRAGPRRGVVVPLDVEPVDRALRRDLRPDPARRPPRNRPRAVSGHGPGRSPQGRPEGRTDHDLAADDRAGFQSGFHRPCDDGRALTSGRAHL